VTTINRAYLKDLAERVAWTAAEAGVALVAVETQDWSGTWVPVIATGLAALKGIIAKHVGKTKGTAALGNGQ
jgi:hypothetical protein